MAWLDDIEEHLRCTSGSKSKKAPPIRYNLGAADLASAERAARLVEALLDAGGAGTKRVLEHLLALVLSCRSSALVPSWERIMLPRNRFQHRDNTASMRASMGGMALRALAAEGDPSACDALLRAIGAVGAADRGGLLVHSIFQLSRSRKDVMERLLTLARSVAKDDPEFEARYLARCALRIGGQETGLDYPDGVFSFSLRYAEFSCSLELLSTSPLHALHSIIQDALRWDADHLWCFHLNGDRRDHRFEWGSDQFPDWISPPELALCLGEDNRDRDDGYSENDRPAGALPGRIGEVGLRAGNSIIYHFDFGDDHLIPLRLHRIDESAPQGVKYPRILASKGKRPQQYPW